MRTLLFLIFFSQSAFALKITDIMQERGLYAEKKIEIEGVITKLKYSKKKYDEYYQLTLKDKFHKEYVKVKFYLIHHDERINEKFNCKIGQFIKVSGNFYAKPKGRNLGELLVQSKTNLTCNDNDAFTKIENTYSLSSLKSNKDKANKKDIKLTGFVSKLSIRESARKTSALFKILGPNKKLHVKVNMLLMIGEEEPINNFRCREGQAVTISGPFVQNKKK